MNDAGEQVEILVDIDDREIGQAPKLAAHKEGRLHRAISVSIVDDGGRMLLQRRARGKYHSGGLWTNACCTHPRRGETVNEAAERRLYFEEFGVSCSLHWLLRTHYRAPVGDLIENEVVHLFWRELCRRGPARPHGGRRFCLDFARGAAARHGNRGPKITRIGLDTTCETSRTDCFWARSRKFDGMAFPETWL